MAQSITADTFWDDCTNTANDTYNVSAGATLTIDTDTRFNKTFSTTTGFFNTINLTNGNLLIDATDVQIIKYDGGASTVPTVDTAIRNSDGSITGNLICVMSAINAAPTAVGGGMPGAGYIKVRSLNGDFGDNVDLYKADGTTKIGTTNNPTGATYANRRGWLEVVGTDSNATGGVIADGMSTVTMTGDLFILETTCDNSANQQQIQLPMCGGTSLWYSGVYIEKTASAGDWELILNVNSYTTTTTVNPTVFATDAARGKVCWIDKAGLLTIKKTSAGGFVWPNGARIAVPNILLLNCASGNPAVNTLSNTLTNRVITNCTKAPVVSYDHVSSSWRNLFSNAKSVSISYCIFTDYVQLDQIGSEVTTFEYSGSALSAGNTQVSDSYVSFVMQLNNLLKGGTLSNCAFAGSTGGSGQSHAAGTVGNFTFDTCRFMMTQNRTAAAQANAYNQQWNAGNDMIYTDCTFVGGACRFVAVSGVTLTDSIYCDNPTNAVCTSYPVSAFAFVYSNTIVVDGVTFGGNTTANPYTAIVEARNSIDITIKNIGTAASPLAVDSTNGMAYIYTDNGAQTSNVGASSDIKIRHVYVDRLRMPTTTTMCWFHPSDSGLIMENIWVTAVTSNLPINQSATLGGCPTDAIFKQIYVGAATPPTTMIASWGTHFYDILTGATTGVLGILLNPPSEISGASGESADPNLDEIQCDTSAIAAGGAGSGFDNNGGLSLRNVDDAVTWTMPYYALGYTEFTNSAPTYSGTNTDHITYEFKIDLNDGNSWSANWETVTAAHLRAYTIDDELGFRLKIRATCSEAATANNLTAIQIPMTTTDTVEKAAASLYPLNATRASLILTGLQNPTEVRVYKTSDDSVVAGTEDVTSGVYTHKYIWTADLGVYIRVFAKSYLPISYTGQTLGSTGLTIPVQQTFDRQYLNPA